MTNRPAITALVFGLLIAASVSAATIPPLPEVDAATAATHPELAKRRAALAVEREVLHAESKKQKDACSAVEVGTPSERDCAAWRDRLFHEVGLHVKATNDLVAAISAAAGYKSFTLPHVSVQGDVYFLTADGRKFTGGHVAGINIDNRTQIVTGKDSQAHLLLLDGTSLTVGPNSELVLDDFVYDPETKLAKLGIQLAKGTFRWVTGKRAVMRIEPKIDLPVFAIGIRGTDVECQVNEAGAGYVKLYSGKLEITSTKTGAITILTGGNMLTFRGTIMDAPTPIP